VWRPLGVAIRAVTIRATPEEIYPWLVQMGGGKGGFWEVIHPGIFIMGSCPPNLRIRGGKKRPGTTVPGREGSLT
jgi:hypothetical protein